MAAAQSAPVRHATQPIDGSQCRFGPHAFVPFGPQIALPAPGPPIPLLELPPQAAIAPAAETSMAQACRTVKVV